MSLNEPAGSHRVREAFAVAKKEERAALVAYLTHGDPSPKGSADVVMAAVEGGADVIELGVPFSDPNADGVVIQAAMHRALEAGASMKTALEGVLDLRRQGVSVPIVLFGYYNPIFVRGIDVFAAEASNAGVDAVLTVDLPIDEIAELSVPLAKASVGVVPLVAPTSTETRIARVRDFSPAFTYYISQTGITGSAFRDSAGGAERIASIQAATQSPVAVGFGIKTVEDASRVAAHADGVVVGSALVAKVAEAGGHVASAADAVQDLVASLRAACRR